MGAMQIPRSQIADAQWIALSDHAGPVNPAGIADMVERGSLVVELVPPTGSSAILLDCRADDGWPRVFSILYESAVGVVVLHRQGASLLRHVLPGPLPQNWRLARLTFAWDGPRREWSVQLDDAFGTWSLRAEGVNPMPLAAADILALCAGLQGTRRDASVQWFGLCLQTPGQTNGAWIGQRTPVDTARGRVAAADLQIGDKIITRDGGLWPLRALVCRTLPNRGRFAPVLLRAPYFARHTDVLVGPNQLVLLTGAAVEYLFGEDAVLAEALALRDGNSALTDARRPLTRSITLDFGAPHVIFADGCPFLVQATGSSDPLPYRLLQGYEAATLQSLLGRDGRRAAA
jgi:hypothetical protein